MTPLLSSFGGGSARGFGRGRTAVLGPGLPVTSLSATPGSTSVQLSWTNTDATAQIRVYRGASLVTTLSAASTTYTNTGLSPITSYSFTVKYFKDAIEGSASNTATTTTLPQGQQLYDTAGTYTFTVPAGVTSVSVCCIGAGGGASVPADAGTYGGGGGALAYKNNVSVTPLATYSVVVGLGNYGVSGGASTITAMNVSAPGGQYGNSGGAGGTGWSGEGGGNGGNGGANNYGRTNSYSTAMYAGGGSGGAGGYGGSGGNGGTNNAAGTNAAGNSGAAGSAGGGGGGGGGSGYIRTTQYYQYYQATSGGGGGGTGIKGQGGDGSGGAGGVTGGGEGGSGQGGSGGTQGSGVGGTYGGGGLSSTASYSWYDQGDPAGGIITEGGGSSGGPGAVRIIWGTGRSYPSNAADV